jgi:hypothetical protein
MIGKRSVQGRSNLSPKKHRRVRRKSPSRSAKQDAKIFAAINRHRRGKAKSASAAARAEGTTLRAIRKRLPGVLIQDRAGGRIRVKPTDRYSARVQVLTTQGSLTVTARGSRQRELAGRHRAAVIRVVRGKESPSALEQFRGKKIGGYELISDYELLSSFAQAGVVGQLDSLYVSPDSSA